jgi:Mannosyl-glycoprotein endo-beta-N-acetylglucosaminidase
MKKKLFMVLLAVLVSFSFICGTSDNSLYTKSCNPQNVYFAIKQLGIKHPDIVFAQILLESDNLNSKLVMSNNNLMGMRLPKKRETTAIQAKCGYAMYASWYSCVADYLLYQLHITKNKDLNRTQYLNLIGRLYSETSDYKSRIRRVLKENKYFIKTQDSLYVSSGYEQVHIEELDLVSK